MEPEPTAPIRKVRFKPNTTRQSTKSTKTAEPKVEVKQEEQDAAQTREFLRRLAEGAGRGKPKVEKKPFQIPMGGIGSRFMGSYTAPRRSASTGGPDQKMEKDYKEPWDYYSNYPITLPLRMPYSGDPVLMDEEEFGEASAELYNEDAINPAADLGLMEEDVETRMMFFQLPTSLPLMKRPPTAAIDEAAESSSRPKPMGHLPKGSRLGELPPGHMGKLLVYKSGKVKLKLGDNLYDVNPGSDCTFVSDVAAINTERKQCCIVGELNKRAVVTPDVDSILSSFDNVL